MTLIAFFLIALAAAFASLHLSVRQARRRLPRIELPPGETMPVTALQRLAGRSLVIILLLTAAAGSIVMYYGPLTAWANDATRIWASMLLIAGLGVFTFYLARVRVWTTREDGTLDERDRAILATAPAGAGPAILVTLAAWMIALTESYHATRQVPMDYLFLVFWSCMMVSVLALLTGVVLGYRRS